MSLDKPYSFLKVELPRLRRKTCEEKYDISVIRIYLLYLQTVLITAGPSQYRMQVSNMFAVNFIISPSNEIRRAVSLLNCSKIRREKWKEERKKT